MRYHKDIIHPVRFLNELRKHWVALVTSSASIGLLYWWQASGHYVAPWLYSVFALVGVIVAAYKMWRKESAKVEELELRLSPRLVGKLDMLALSPAGSRNQDVLVIVSGSIDNPYGPPVSIVEWRVRLVFPDSMVVRGVMPMQSGKDIHVENIVGRRRDEKMVLQISHYWPWSTNETPIPAGGTRSGWLMAVFDGITKEDLNKENVSIVVEFKDVTETIHSMTKLFLDVGPNFRSLGDIKNR